MKIDHHPSDETLMRYAAGTLEAGPAIVVGAHLEHCAACRDRVASFEAVGGAVLAEIEPTPMSPNALARALAAIEEMPADEAAADRSERAAPIILDGVRLPDALRDASVGRWRWMGPGMRFSRVRLPHDPRANVMLLKVAPGRALPEHGHTGTEFTYVVRGSFSDETGRYGPGDLAEMGADVEHEPIVDEGEDCICLAALDGRMRFNGLIGRLVQPFYGV